eukprot:m.22789 g.22789  ORF g.22789 m.22789 type:complete len:202 (-) comp6953_c0_seq1:154-759(-)
MAVFETTLLLVKPDAVRNGDAPNVLAHARKAGFTVLEQRRLRLTPEQASEFYAEHYGKTFFSSLVTFMSSGPLVAAVLAKSDAVPSLRALVGPTDSNKARETHPTSLRALFGTDGQRNAVHASDSPAATQREIRFFFPQRITEPLASASDGTEYLGKEVNPTLILGLTALCKAKPAHPTAWLADWLLKNNPNKPSVEEPDD